MKNTKKGIHLYRVSRLAVICPVTLCVFFVKMFSLSVFNVFFVILIVWKNLNHRTCCKQIGNLSDKLCFLILWICSKNGFIFLKHQKCSKQIGHVGILLETFQTISILYVLQKCLKTF